MDINLIKVKIKAEIIDDLKIKKIILKEDPLPFLIFIYLLTRGKRFELDEITRKLGFVFFTSEKQVNTALFVLEITAGLIKTSGNSLEIVDCGSFIAVDSEKYIILQEDYFENGEDGKVKDWLKKEGGFEVVELWILTLFTVVLCGDDGQIGKNELMDKLIQLQAGA